VKENVAPNRKPTRMIEAKTLRLCHPTEQISNQTLQLRRTTSIDRQEFSARAEAFQYGSGFFGGRKRRPTRCHEFRTEFFNANLNFNNLDAGLQEGNLGQTSSGGSPRILQMALRFKF
jgi:hypothetical protein